MINLIKINASKMTSRPAGYQSHQMAKCSTEHLYSALLLYFWIFFSEFQIRPLIKKNSSSTEKSKCLYLAIGFSEMYMDVFFYCWTCMGESVFLEQVDLSHYRHVEFGWKLGLPRSEQCRKRGNKCCAQLVRLGMAASSCLPRKRGDFSSFFFSFYTNP